MSNLTSTSSIVVLIREGSYGRALGNVCWRQYLIVTDERVAIVDMVPAMYGWNFGKVTVQDGDAWRGQDCDSILDWKRRAGDEPVLARIDGVDRAKLLALASVGAQ